MALNFETEMAKEKASATGLLVMFVREGLDRGYGYVRITMTVSMLIVAEGE